MKKEKSDKIRHKPYEPITALGRTGWILIFMVSPVAATHKENTVVGIEGMLYKNIWRNVF
ncbi:MAG: hypothetical protein LBE13_06060 [Bacteroidales bacterium]|jgi:hypothetical protein|nr:hypothetical protein [Bacteroidales bacterium]